MINSFNSQALNTKKMKKVLFAVMMAMLAVGADANDRFYIEDLNIVAGETLTVNILLDNELTYTAFQTDIYMPEGFMIEHNEGDYIFNLTERKSHDHIIASQLQVDGSIRIMSYSLRINPYNGNSGALVTFNVTAEADFCGSTTITLKNTLFTTTTGEEIPFCDEDCTVTAANLKGDVNGDGSISIGDVTIFIDFLLGGGNIPNFRIENADVNDDGGVSIGDVTTLIDELLASGT